MKYFFLITSLISFIGCSAQSTNTLNIRCFDKLINEGDDIVISVEYKNVSNSDTLLLPYYAFRLSNYQSIKFLNIRDWTGPLPSLGPIVGHLNELGNTTYCNYSDALQDKNFIVLFPSQSIMIDYKLASKGNKLNYPLNYTYDYMVTLEIDSSFKKICSNMWTGNAVSNIGAFIIR